MKRFKNITGVLSVVLIAIAFAALVTYVTTPEEDRPEIPSIQEALFENDERQIDWDSLPPEVIAWVDVPGTEIDEPIVQATPDAPNAYLHIYVMGQGAYGTPYIDCECSLDSPFVMVYGHHMSDGSAFADFASFIDETYAREHDEIILYQREGDTLHLAPIAVDIVNASREKLNIDQDLAPTKRIAGSDLILDEASDESQLFAFTTCSYQTWNSRTVVYALDDKLVVPDTPNSLEGI